MVRCLRARPEDWPVTVPARGELVIPFTLVATVEGPFALDFTFAVDDLGKLRMLPATVQGVALAK